MAKSLINRGIGNSLPEGWKIATSEDLQNPLYKTEDFVHTGSGFAFQPKSEAMYQFNGRNTPIPDAEFNDYGSPSDFTLDNSRGIKPGVENKSILSANPQGVTANSHIPGELEDELNGLNSDRDVPKDFSDYGGPKGLATIDDGPLATETDKFGPLSKSPDPREVISNVIGYLHDNGLGDIGHAVFNMALPRLTPIVAALKPTALSSDDTLENRPDLKYGGLRDETQKAFSPDMSDASDTADRAINSLEAPTFNVGSSSGRSGSNSTLSSPAPLKMSSNTMSNDSPMSDEEIHQWNLQHNPNYDPSSFDIASNSFNYNH